MNLAFDIFGQNAFRKLSSKVKRQQPLNKSLFEAWSVNLSQLTNEEINLIKVRKQDLINKFIHYVDNDRDFFKSISQAAEKVQYRFSTIEKIIQEVLS